MSAQQERHLRPPAPPHARDHLQGRLVHGAPHPRGHARLAALRRWAAKARSLRPTKPITASPRRDTLSPQRRGRPYSRAASGADKRADRRAGRARRRCSLIPCRRLPTPRTCTKIVHENIASETRLHTDESRLYTGVGEQFASARNGQALARNEYARGDVTHQFGRRLLLNLQTRHARRLSALRREAFASLSRGIRFPLQSPDRPRLQRWGSCGACHEGCSGQASHVSATSLSLISLTLSALCAGGRNYRRARSNAFGCARDNAPRSAVVCGMPYFLVFSPRGARHDKPIRTTARYVCR